jgi:hypothetical protein
MMREEMPHLNKRPIRVKVFGWIDPTTGGQLVEFRVRYEANVHVSSYAFPPDIMQHIPHLAPTAMAGLRRAWRALREGLRKKMHGDNFRERWRIERMRRAQIDTWDRFEGPLLGFVHREPARRRFVASLDRIVGVVPTYTGHDYARRVDDEHRFKVQTTGTY